MNRRLAALVEEAEQAAMEVLRHNSRGPCEGLFRTAGQGYPEPYTRDLMISSLGILASGDKKLIEALRRVLVALARNQTELGHITSLAHDPDDRGASDTTPLFLVGAALFRRVTGERDFLADAVDRSLLWMRYQSPDDLGMVSQQPTSDWRDEHWVMGFGLYVNALVHLYLRLHGMHRKAAALAKLINQEDVRKRERARRIHEGLVVKDKPYYGLWVYKLYNDERFDLLGNSLAILSGAASVSRARKMIAWIESQCEELRRRSELAVDLPPCLFPYMQPTDSDWRPRYEQFNQPGEYHNGGVWPFICGFYVAALAAAGRQSLAEKKLAALTDLVRPVREMDARWGFNEWFSAQDGQPRGQDWQTWSAAMYVYAVHCVRNKRALLLPALS